MTTLSAAYLERRNARRAITIRLLIMPAVL